jgi:ferredoxin
VKTVTYFQGLMTPERWILFCVLSLLLSLVLGVGLVFGHDLPSPEDTSRVRSLHKVVSEMKARQASPGGDISGEESNMVHPHVHAGGAASSDLTKARPRRMFFVMSVILLSGLIGIGILYQRRSLQLAAGQKANLLDIRWVGRIFRSGRFPTVFQVPMLSIFLIIIAAGLFDVQQGDRNIATLLMWTIWWTGIIFTFVFVGRIWCMMCPVGAVQDWAGRLIGAKRDFPGPLRNIYLSSFMFFALTWWDCYSGIVNRPALTAYILLGFFAAATGMALTFKGRSFCRYVCPVGGLIGLYSMFSPLELRNRCLEVCRGHEVKECVSGTEKGRPCPMFVTPMTLDRNNYCTFCSECVKSCSQDNIVIRFRSFARDLWISSRGHLDEAVLAIVLVGVTTIVTGNMIAPWHGWMGTVGKFLPLDAFGIVSHGAREKAASLFVLTAGSLAVFPLLLLAGSLAVRKCAGTGSPLSLKETFIQFAYMFVPVGLSMHLAHNINHLLKEGPAIVPAVKRLAYVWAGAGSDPEWRVIPLMGSESIFWFQMVIVFAVNIISLYAGYRIAARYFGDRALRAFIPMALIELLFMVINVFILDQPMEMRHTHGG